MCLPNFMKFRHCLYKVLKNQNVAHGRADNVKTVYPNKYSLWVNNEFCCHGALFLLQLQHFMNIGFLSNIAAMATVMRFYLKITANLTDKI